MEPHERVGKPLKQILVNNFLGGIAWSLGVTVGLSVIVTVLGYIISKVDLIPIIGNFVSQVLDSVVIRTPPLVK